MCNAHLYTTVVRKIEPQIGPQKIAIYSHYQRTAKALCGHLIVNRGQRGWGVMGGGVFPQRWCCMMIDMHLKGLTFKCLLKAHRENDFPTRQICLRI